MKASYSAGKLSFDAHPVLSTSEIVSTDFGVLTAGPGDWVIRDESGRFATVMPPALFHDLFKLDEKSIDKDALSEGDEKADQQSEAAAGEREDAIRRAEILQARRDARMVEIARHQQEAIKAAEKEFGDEKAARRKKAEEAEEEKAKAGQELRERGPSEAPEDPTSPRTPADSSTDQPKERVKTSSRAGSK